MLILLLVAAVGTLLVFWWWTVTSKENERFMELANKIPGPTRLPIIGSAMEYGTDSQQFLSNMMRLVDKFGEVTAHWLGPLLHIIVYSPEDMEILLSSKTIIEKSYTYKFFKTWLGSGLISSEGEKWRKHKKLLTPAFHFKILENYVQVFDPNLKILVDKLEVELDKDEFNIQHYIDKSSLDIVSESAMATDVRSEKNESDFRNALKETSFAVLYRTFKPWLHSDFMFNWSSIGANYNKGVKTIQDFIGMVISKRRKEKLLSNENINEKTDEADYFGYKKRIGFLDLLLQFASDENNKLTDQDIRDEVNTFMFAGHDTTASALSFICYLLSRHPKVQEKVVEEICEVYGDLSDKPITYSDLLSLKYLERVIKEALRLFPSVPFVGRRVTEEIAMSNGKVLPIGSAVILLFYKLHRDPKVFPKPEEFNPDNFLPERLVGRHPFSYCPFSAGPRNCIGQKFAMLEMKATILCILRKYCLFPGKTDIVPCSELVLRSSTGVHVAIKKRVINK